MIDSLTPIPLDSIGGVCGYYIGQHGYLSSWIGKTIQVWARFPDQPLPPLMLMRDVMLEAFEPSGKFIEPPPGLIACICFKDD